MKSERVFKKWGIMVSIIFVCAGGLQAQINMNEKAEGSNSEISIIKFTAEKLSGKIYVNWLAVSNSDENIFVLEKTVEREKYNVVFMKEGATSPNKQALLFSFIDENGMEGHPTYRLSSVDSGKQTILAVYELESDGSPENKTQHLPENNYGGNPVSMLEIQNPL